MVGKGTQTTIDPSQKIRLNASKTTTTVTHVDSTFLLRILVQIVRSQAQTISIMQQDQIL